MADPSPSGVADHSPERALKELLQNARGLSQEQERARRRWVSALPEAADREALFEFEMLLKGMAAFGTANNRPGPRGKNSWTPSDPRGELRILREGTARTLSLCRSLMGTGKHGRSGDYFSSEPEDATFHDRSFAEHLRQDTPQRSLNVMSQALHSLQHVIDGSLDLAQVPTDLVHSIHSLIVREIARSVFFDPLVPLEFRPEFDKIRVPAVLEALANSRAPAAHRALSLAFLSLFRCLRYLHLADQYATRSESVSLAYLTYAALRSDLRVLCRFLGEQAAGSIANQFEAQLLAVPASQLRAKRAALTSSAESLMQLRGLLESLANTLRVEANLAFEHDIPTVAKAEQLPPTQLGPQLAVASASLRAALHHAAYALTSELVAEVPPSMLGSSYATRRDAGIRLRRDLWMFSQVLRAFLAKTQAAGRGSEAWDEAAGFHFVGEFLSHFRAIGFQLVRGADYDRLEPLLESLNPLRARDLIDPERLETATSECLRLQSYLDELFHEVSKREELRDAPFDKKLAALSLRIYLGARK